MKRVWTKASIEKEYEIPTIIEAYEDRGWTFHSFVACGVSERMITIRPKFVCLFYKEP